MNIEQMAQAYILNEIRRIGICAVDNKIILDAWSIASRMQAEADKRKEKGVPEAILKALNSMELEWQPDWDKIPDGFDWWAMDKKGKAHCFDREPVIDSPEWVMVGSNGNYQSSLTFNYQDDWRDSLRKRPEMEVERNG